MALGAAAALLDELMGRTRNFDPNEKPPELSWEDEQVCKHYLCGFCPHELFTNTRADLDTGMPKYGRSSNCNKIHDEAIRKLYQESPRFEKMGYETEFIRFLQNMISDVEKRIRRGHQRLALSAYGNLNGGFSSTKDDKIEMLTEKINELVNQAEELGCEGKVEEAQGVMKLCDQLKEERQQIQNSSNDDMPPVKQMEVCEVCGAFLIVGDAPQRQDEHLMGKQHAGYAQVRAEIERRKLKAKTEQEEKEQKKIKERENREKEIEREREERKKKEKEREEREKREREKVRDRRRRSRSRSRGRRSRSRERRRSGSRERRRSRDRRRRSRSKSRDRRKSSKSSRRSRSRDKESSSSCRDKDHKKDKDRDTRSKSQSKDREAKRRSRSSEKGERSQRPSSDKDEGKRSEGDTKKE